MPTTKGGRSGRASKSKAKKRKTTYSKTYRNARNRMHGQERAGRGLTFDSSKGEWSGVTMPKRTTK